MHYFIDQLQGNRIGLITFSESAYALSPLTNDYGLLARQIDRLEPAVLTGRTTDVSYGLMYTLNHLTQNHMDMVEQKPALVLLSDVKRPSRDISPLLVAQQFKQRGYTLHTIAIGSGDIESQQSNGMELIYQPTSFTLLSDIAEAGGGRFFIANNTASLKQAVLNIQEAERRQVEQAPRFVRITLYYWPLAVLLGLVMLMQLWRVVRP
jgi:Ca-activated chloride channel family protein